MKTFYYALEGTAADNQTWKFAGSATIANADVTDVFTAMMRDTFQALTSGKAIFGNPGVGCKGPYSITRIVIERAPGTLQ